MESLCGEFPWKTKKAPGVQVMFGLIEKRYAFLTIEILYGGLTKKAGVIRKAKHGVVTRGMVIGDWTVSDETRTMHFETARNISSVWSKLESGMLGLRKVPDES